MKKNNKKILKNLLFLTLALILAISPALTQTAKASSYTIQVPAGYNGTTKLQSTGVSASYGKHSGTIYQIMVSGNWGYCLDAGASAKSDTGVSCAVSSKVGGNFNQVFNSGCPYYAVNQVVIWIIMAGQGGNIAGQLSSITSTSFRNQVKSWTGQSDYGTACAVAANAYYGASTGGDFFVYSTGLVGYQRMLSCATPYVSSYNTVVIEIPYTAYFNENKPSLSLNNPVLTGDRSKTVYEDHALGTVLSVTLTGYTFQGWYSEQSGGKYMDENSIYTWSADHTFYARWSDNAPDLSVSATPISWNAGNGTVKAVSTDTGSGIGNVYIYCTSINGVATNSLVYSKNHYYEATSSATDVYTEKREGTFTYKVVVADRSGTTTTKNTATIKLDHSNPEIIGLNKVNTDWTNVSPIFNLSSTDYLSGSKIYNGSGVKSIIIIDDNGKTVASGTNTVKYTIPKTYEGIHTWTIKCSDKVNHVTTKTVVTKYDVTAPGIDGDEITTTQNGTTVSGYCQNNIINQNIDDESVRSVYAPNVTSGLKSVQLFAYVNGEKLAVNTAATEYSFNVSDTHSNCNVYYDINSIEQDADYYLLYVQDYAGNISVKKLTSQKALLKSFHTSISRGTYEN